MFYTTSKLWNDDLSSIFKDFKEAEKRINSMYSKGHSLYDYVTQTEDDGTTIFVAIPGMDREKLQIKVLNNMLHIDYTPEKDIFNRGSFSQKYTLTGVDTEKVTSEYKDGILKISLPKLEKIAPKNIDVKFV